MRTSLQPLGFCCLLTWASAAFSAETAESLQAKAKAALAQIEGEIAVPGLLKPVEVLRDAWGVPHIYAQNQHDLFFAQGFVAAQDRLFQIDLWRRSAIGETAAVLGPPAIEADRFARLIRYRGDLEAEWTSYSPDTREIAAAFTDGHQRLYRSRRRSAADRVSTGRLPPRQVAAGRLPGAHVGHHDGPQLPPGGEPRTARGSSGHREGALAFAEPIRCVNTLSADGLDLTGIDAPHPGRLRGGDEDVCLQSARRREATTGSIDGTLSRSGKPLMASDPHRALTLPVAALPGAPCTRRAGT